MPNSSNDIYRVLVADDIHPVFFDILRDGACILDYQPDISYEEALGSIDKYDGLVLRSKFKVGRDFLDAAAKLKFIGRAGAGVDNIDVAYAQIQGITLLSAPEGNCDAVAEHMMGMLLALMNNLRKGNLEISSQIWNREGNRGVELGGKTVGLIGYGNNGRAMARKLAGFDVIVLAYDKYLIDFPDNQAQPVSLERLFEEADVVSLHIPLTAETRHWVDATFFAQFRKPIFFLNGSRGEIVVIEDLLQALNEKKVKGAALDVLPVEKFPSLAEASWYSNLIERSNILLSPHVAGWSVESYYKIAEVLARKIQSLLQKKVFDRPDA